MPTVRIAPDPEMHYLVDDYTDPWRDPETILLLHGNCESGAAWFGWVREGVRAGERHGGERYAEEREGFGAAGEHARITRVTFSSTPCNAGPGIDNAALPLSNDGIMPP